MDKALIGVDLEPLQEVLEGVLSWYEEVQGGALGPNGGRPIQPSSAALARVRPAGRPGPGRPRKRPRTSPPDGAAPTHSDGLSSEHGGSSGGEEEDEEEQEEEGVERGPGGSRRDGSVSGSEDEEGGTGQGEDGVELRQSKRRRHASRKVLEAAAMRSSGLLPLAVVKAEGAQQVVAATAAKQVQGSVEKDREKEQKGAWDSMSGFMLGVQKATCGAVAAASKPTIVNVHYELPPSQKGSSRLGLKEQQQQQQQTSPGVLAQQQQQGPSEVDRAYKPLTSQWTVKEVVSKGSGLVEGVAGLQCASAQVPQPG